MSPSVNRGQRLPGDRRRRHHRLHDRRPARRRRGGRDPRAGQLRPRAPANLAAALASGGCTSSRATSATPTSSATSPPARTSSSTRRPSGSPSAPRSRGWRSRCSPTARSTCSRPRSPPGSTRSSRRPPPRCTAWPTEFPTTELHHPCDNDTFYGAAKVFNEGMLRSFHAMYGLDYVALRYFNVYGPRMDIHGLYTEVLIRWMERIEAGQPPLIFGDGLQTMDFVFTTDIARANLLAAESDVDRRRLQHRQRAPRPACSSSPRRCSRSWAAATCRSSSARRARSTGSPGGSPTSRPRGSSSGWKPEVDLTQACAPGRVVARSEREACAMIPVMKPWLGEEEAAGGRRGRPRPAGWRRARGSPSSSSAFAERVGAAARRRRLARARPRCTWRSHLLGIGPGDEVVVPSLLVHRDRQRGAYVGATPVFADVDPDDRQPHACDRRARSSPAHPRRHRGPPGRRAGRPRRRCARCATAAGSPLVEDAACAAGSTYRGRPVGRGRGDRRLVVPPAQDAHHRRGRHDHDVRPALGGPRPRRLREHGMNVSAADRHAAGSRCSRATSRSASTTG